MLNARGRRIAIATIMSVSAASGAVLACNAIVGVEDVKLAPLGGGNGDGGEEELLDGEVPLGDGDTPANDIGSLALGFLHACARLPSGAVRCWGDNGAGQLGDGIPFDAGKRNPALVPQAVPKIKDAVAIASGLSHTCVAHRDTGKVSCWGINTFGQLGDGTKERSSSPISVPNLDGVTQLAGGTSFTCALRKDKTVACWGANYGGQLGDGTKTNDRLTALAVKGLSNVASIAAAEFHACAVLESGEVMCWGQNDDGQLGIGSTVESLLPTKLTALEDIAQVAAAARFSCARQKTGRVYCWGNNEFGQLGTGSANPAPNPSPSIVPSVGDAIFIWAGYEHACAVRKGGAVACWGSADEGQLGFGSVPTDASIATPVAVVGVTNVQNAWTGGNRSCALRADGRAFCWGQNTLGMLGNGTTERAYAAVPVSDFP